MEVCSVGGSGGHFRIGSIVNTREGGRSEE